MNICMYVCMYVGYMTTVSECIWCEHTAKTTMISGMILYADMYVYVYTHIHICKHTHFDDMRIYN